jgi:two-component SAPR family response regulator
VAEAIAALKNSGADAAVLDINLGGEVVYPLADVLRAAGVPFIFVTGYGEVGVEGRFKNIPVLQKPIDGQMLRRVFVSPKGVSNGMNIHGAEEMSSLRAAAK